MQARRGTIGLDRHGLFLGQMLGTLIDAASRWRPGGGLRKLRRERRLFEVALRLAAFRQRSAVLRRAAESGRFVPDTHVSGRNAVPDGRVMALFAHAVPAGSIVRTVAVPASLRSEYAPTDSRAAAEYDRLLQQYLTAVAVSAQIANASRTSFRATLETYGKAQYDESQNDRWLVP